MEGSLVEAVLKEINTIMSLGKALVLASHLLFQNLTKDHARLSSHRENILAPDRLTKVLYKLAGTLVIMDAAATRTAKARD